MLAVIPEFLLFVQHGWADDNRAMIDLARRLTPEPSSETTTIIAPNLGFIDTWLRIKPLVQRVEAIALEQINRYPYSRIQIIGHSMGGLIWLEVLHRHPEWWSNVLSLVLIASPVGGADLGRIIDPLNVGVGIASDLGTNRKAIAELIAREIPTLIIAGDMDGGSDGTIPIACTQFAGAQFICLPGLSHAVLRNHPEVVAVIQQFWKDSTIGNAVLFNEVIQQIQQVQGITDGHERDFTKAAIVISLKNGGTIRTWRNLLGVDHVFVASPEGRCLYAGFVGWLHSKDLYRTLDIIQQANCCGT